jgi:SAM-dependent methyltransferase
LTEAWPGESRRHPSRAEATYTVRAPLARWLEQEGLTARGLRVLDVGCGVKPYYPFFAGAAEYIGVDIVDNPVAELKGPVEALPVEDARFDIVLCNQVLEHADDPSQAVRELRRVTAPGGRVLASTHGVQVYHPSPNDLWRWTHAGLEKLFRDNGDWATLEVRPGAGTTACIGMLLTHFIEILAGYAHLRPAARPFVAGVNTAAAALDQRVTSLREPVPGSIFANYHVSAAVAA